ncbi:MAG: hypothetical protein ACRDXX_05015 [Stackebrandtia sp.]
MSTEQYGQHVDAADTPRPAAVTWAGYAGFAILALAVLGAVASLVWIGALLDALETGLQGVELEGDVAVEDAVTVVRIAMYGIVLLSLVAPLVVAILSAIHMRGSNGARITTWVFAGLGVCCGLLTLPFGGDFESAFVGDDALAQKVQDVVADADLPVWGEVVPAVVSVATLLLYIAIIVLLALPSSNEYFRARPPEPTVLPPTR